MTNETKSKPFANPYLAGLMLGATLLASFVLLGAGLGASSGLARVGCFLERCVAAGHVDRGEYFAGWGDAPLRYYLVFMLGGVLLGGVVSALFARRIAPQLERGRACPAPLRAALALLGGIVVGYASRLAQGCTSGQALTGGALLLTGSLVFMGCVFAGGYAFAYFVGRQWHD